MSDEQIHPYYEKNRLKNLLRLLSKLKVPLEEVDIVSLLYVYGFRYCKDNLLITEHNIVAVED